MEAKKTIEADLGKFRKLFLNIGLVISMFLVVMVFEWKTYDDVDLITVSNLDETIFDETVEIPLTVQPPPPPPVVRQATILEIPDDEEIIEEIEIDLDIEIFEETRIEEYIVDTPQIEEEEVEEIFTIVEFSPTPVGGFEAFYKALGKEIKYPSSATRLGIEGKVFVEFVVGRNGELTDIKVVKGISADCNEEAIRVLKKMPKWKPGKQRGRTVKVRMVVPIIYKLN